MKIFKENSYDIIRLYVNQLGIMIFSMLLYTAVGSFDNERLSLALSIFVSVFSICFYLALVYYVMWEIGAKDKIRIDAGKMDTCKNKGALMGLFANVPNLILAVLTLIPLVIYFITDGDSAYSAFAILNLILRFHGSMYLGVITAVIPPITEASPDMIEFLLETLMFLVMPIISILSIHLSYRLGLKDRKILSLRKKK